MTTQGRRGPEIQVSAGLVMRLVHLDEGDTPLVDVRHIDRSDWTTLELHELVAAIDLASGRPVQDVDGFTYQGDETLMGVR